MDKKEKVSDLEKQKSENLSKDEIQKNAEHTTKEEEAHLNKEKITHQILKSSEERENLLNRNETLQLKLFMFIKGSAEKEYFQTLELPLNANVNTYRVILGQINEKLEQIKKEQLEILDEKSFLEQKISEKEEACKEFNKSFAGLKARIAQKSVNTDNGEQYTKEEVDDLLKREEETRRKVVESQLQSIRKNRLLEELMEEKKNLVEGPLDFGEFEIMCTGTENNIEVVKQLKEEIRSYVQKSSEVVNVMNHMWQKMHAGESKKKAAKAKEQELEEELTELRNELFEEKMKYASMNQKNEDLQHKSILLQHPRLIEDYKDLIAEKEEGKKELEELKTMYKAVMKIVSKHEKRSHS